MEKNQLPPLQQASIFDVRAMSEAERAKLGYLVLVMRRWPQGFSWEALDLQLWLPDAGPSPELLKAYQAKQMDWEEFAQRYRVEQLSHWVEPSTIRWGKGRREDAKVSCLRSSIWMHCAGSTVLSMPLYHLALTRRKNRTTFPPELSSAPP